MRNYLLAILLVIFLFFSQNVIGCDVFDNTYDFITVPLQVEEENCSQKKYQNNPEAHHNLDANTPFELFVFHSFLIDPSIENTHREADFADQPFTPPDVIQILAFT
jgi:hypothetical protein